MRDLKYRKEKSMPTVRDIDRLMSDFAPKNLSEPWDNDGIMLCGDLEAEIKRAVVCLEVNKAAIDFAAMTNAQCIITHHPFIFKPLKSVSGETFCSIEKLITSRISVLSYHTRLDCADGGVNDLLAKRLGLSDISSFSAEDGGAKMGRFGSLEREIDINDFASFVKSTLHSEGLRFSSPKGKKVNKAAVLGGAGKDFLRGAVNAGADVFVSADLSHNTFLDGTDMGIAVIDAGHYSTENLVTSLIAELIGRLSVETEIFDVGSPYMGI